ncbi:hypothetical protein RHGRI_005786 [Rhododendron griersonianum]|uniref:Major facilitator superfamily (MFS) profile domain-containing protein n=1 Tax=Rhododendron griersonianum TaxID=479676 RepID=A0AAV6LEK3_9ERIC|nr:hypothetical protein RHGRI_005786 [Rhododendron griersonianum]
MPGGGFVSGSGTGKAYLGKLTRNVVVTCIVASMGGLISSYDIGISGGVTSMDSFLRKFFHTVYRKEKEDRSTNQDCMFDSQMLTLFTSSLYLAALVSSIVASVVTRKFGGKRSMLLGGVLFCAGAGINGAAQAMWMLIVGCILLGGWGWRLSLGVAVVPALTIIIGSLFLPETPNSMIERGRGEEAKIKLQKIRGVDDVDEEFNDLVAASEAAKKVEHPWGNLL